MSDYLKHIFYQTNFRKRIEFSFLARLVIFSIIFLSISENTFSTTYTWTGTVNSDWYNSLNWSPAGYPTNADDIVVGAGANQPVLDSAKTVVNLTVNSGASINMNLHSLGSTGNFIIASGGSININGDTLWLSGVSSFNGGSITNSGATGLVSVSGSTTTFGNGAGGPTISANISVNSSTLTFRNTTFNNNTTLEKNAGGNDNCTGNNTFNGITNIINSSTTGYIVLSNTTRDIFNGDVTFTNSGTSILYVAHNNAGTQFNSNIIVSVTGTGSVRFSQASGTCTLASGKTITMGTWGTSGGLLYLRHFTQTGSTPQNISMLSGIGTIYIQTGTTFDGVVHVNFPQVFLNGATYNDSVTIEKNGATNNAGSGGNTFNKPVSIINSGSGYLLTSNNTFDVFNDDVTVTNSGSSLIYLAYNDASGTIFNGNIFVNSTGGTGVRFGAAAGTATLANNKTITIGAAGFSSGTLLLRNFTQIGTTTQSLTATGTAGIILGPSSTFNADLTSNSPSLLLNGTTFNGLATFTKTGTSNDAGTGGNTFNQDLSVSITGTGYLQFNGAGNDVYKGNITLENSGGGVRFGQNAGTCTLDPNKSILIGALGFSSGNLLFGNFTQLGSLAQNLALTGTAALYLQAGTIFNADVTFVAPQLYLNGATFEGITVLEKNGATNNSSTGGNTFNGITTITNSGTALLRLSNTTFDIFNNDVTFTNTGTNQIQAAYNDATGTQFNGNIVVNCTGGTGIQFGSSSGTATLADTKTISAGLTGFNVGTLLLRNFTQTGLTSQIVALTGTSGITFGPASTFNADITTNSAALLFNGCTFNGNGTFTKTGTSNDASIGGNTFNQLLTATNTGTGYLSFNGASSDSYNGDIVLSNTGGGFRFGQNAGTCTLANTKTISIGGGGFTGGGLYLRNFTQTGPTPQALTLTGTSVLYLQAGSTFNGDIVFTSPQLYLNGATYNGLATLEKTGATNNAGTGGNVFNQATNINNSGTGYLMSSNTTRDIFNADVTITNTGTNLIYLAYNDATGTQFNGNIIVNETSGTGIQFGASAGTAILAATKTITVGAGGFTTGTLLLKNFTQTGATPQSLTLTGTGGLTFGSVSTFDGKVTSSSAALLMNGCTFNDSATFVKTGSTSDQSAGNNIFNGKTSFTNNGTGYILLGRITRDIFNDDVIFTNAASSLIHVAYSCPTSTQFNGNIYVNSSAGTGVQFSVSTGTSILASGKSVFVGATGFTTGTLLLRNFTQNGGTPQSITLAGTATLTLGSSSIFNAKFTSSSSALLLNGAAFADSATFTKYGTTNDQSAGNNTFNGITTITNSGTGYVLLANTSPDIFNNDVIFTNTNTNIIYPAYNGVAGTQFHGNIILNNTSTGSIRFGQNTGTATLSTGKTVTIGPSGFANGALYFRNFTQSGSTAQTLTITGTPTTLYLQVGTTFNGDINFSFPQVYLNGSTFNGPTIIEKNGATNNACTGANTFNGVTTIKNSGTAYLRLANTTGDIFNGDVTFLHTATGALNPAYNGSNTFGGNISTIGTNAALTFGSGTGISSIVGSVLQYVNGNSGLPPVFTRLTMNNGINGLTLNVPVTVSATLTLTAGNINTTSVNLLTLSNGMSVVGVSDASFVVGPVKKIGNQAFAFPVGGQGFYHPLGITAPGVATDQFTAEYLYIDPNSSYDVTLHDPTIDHLSRCEYWTLNRNLGASNVTVSLGWNASSCGVTTLADLKVCRWDVATTKWKDMGNAGTTGNTTAGSVTSSLSSTIFGAFTLGSNTAANPLPIQLLDFEAQVTGSSVLVTWSTQSEINNDYFTVERSADGITYNTIFTLRGAGNSNSLIYYSCIDDTPIKGLSFYRLRQTDYNGLHKVNEPDRVYYNFNEIVTLSPNPFESRIAVNVLTPIVTKFKIELSDMRGGIIFSSILSFSKDQDAAELDMSSAKPGIYILRIIGDDRIYDTRKMIKL